jgi:hypothetical protein
MPTMSLVQLVTWTLVGGAAAYVALLAGMFVVMYQPPERFGQVMRHFPMRAMPLVPFEAMWNVARRGPTRAGGMAPEFALPTEPAGGPRFRQLHLTAVQAGGSRLERALPALPA